MSTKHPPSHNKHNHRFILLSRNAFASGYSLGEIQISLVFHRCILNDSEYTRIM